MLHSQNATIFNIRRKGPRTSRPASARITDSPRRTNNVIDNWRINSIIMLRRDKQQCKWQSGKISNIQATHYRTYVCLTDNCSLYKTRTEYSDPGWLAATVTVVLGRTPKKFSITYMRSSSFVFSQTRHISKQLSTGRKFLHRSIVLLFWHAIASRVPTSVPFIVWNGHRTGSTFRPNRCLYWSPLGAASKATLLIQFNIVFSSWLHVSSSVEFNTMLLDCNRSTEFCSCGFVPPYCLNTTGIKGASPIKKLSQRE